MVTFPVSEVAVENHLLQPGSLAKALKRGKRARVEASMPQPQGFVRTDEHGFLGAARLAFSHHLPLRIRPDDVWLLLVQGFAKHVEAHADTLRDRLVAHRGTLDLRVQRDDFVLGAEDNDWASVLPEFAAALHKHIGPRHDLLVGDFSTTTALDHILGSIALMDVMQSYFGYAVWTLCGIPRITLTGTPDDWKAIRARARVFAEFDLGWWCDALEPALTHFVDASEGRVDRAMWQSFYKWREASGGPQVSGWVNVFFPYVRVHGEPTDGGRGTAKRNRYAETWDLYPGEGTATADVPGGLRSVPVQWHHLGTRIPLQFVGGFAGAHQDPDGTVSPQLGWGVLAEHRKAPRGA